MNLKWSHYAQSDRDRIYDYIDRENPRAAILVDERIADATTTLKQFPETGRPGRIEGTRELVVQRTPYIVAYRIDHDIIRILRVLHGAQQWPNTMPKQASSGARNR